MSFRRATHWIQKLRNVDSILSYAHCFHINSIHACATNQRSSNGLLKSLTSFDQVLLIAGGTASVLPLTGRKSGDSTLSNDLLVSCKILDPIFRQWADEPYF